MADLGFKGLLWLQGGGWMKARTESQRPYEAALITQSWLMPHTETTDTCLRWGFHPPPCLSSWLYCIFMQNILMLWRSKHWFRSYYFFKWCLMPIILFPFHGKWKAQISKEFWNIQNGFHPFIVLLLLCQWKCISSLNKKPHKWVRCKWGLLLAVIVF